MFLETENRVHERAIQLSNENAPRKNDQKPENDLNLSQLGSVRGLRGNFVGGPSESPESPPDKETTDAAAV